MPKMLKSIHVCQSYSKPIGGTFFETRCRMWADAQRDGRPAEYTWRPVLNAATANKLNFYAEITFISRAIPIAAKGSANYE